MDLKPVLNNKWLLLLGIIGILFILLGPVLSQVTNSLSKTGETTPVAGNSTNAVESTSIPASVEAYQNAYDKQLTQMLSQMQGINKVSVMVTLDSSGQVEVANNTRNSTQTTQASGNSGSSTTSSTTDTEVFTESNSDGGKVPYVVESITPQVRGVLVTVDAENFYDAKLEIVDAITNVLDVPAYKISVEPQKTSS